MNAKPPWPGNSCILGHGRITKFRISVRKMFLSMHRRRLEDAKRAIVIGPEENLDPGPRYYEVHNVCWLLYQRLWSSGTLRANQRVQLCLHLLYSCLTCLPCPKITRRRPSNICQRIWWYSEHSRPARMGDLIMTPDLSGPLLWSRGYWEILIWLARLRMYHARRAKVHGKPMYNHPGCNVHPMYWSWSEDNVRLEVI